MNSSFWWILLALGVYGVLHSLLAGQRAKRLAERTFGAAGVRWYRLAFSILGGLTFIPVLLLVALLPDAPLYRIPMPLSLLWMACIALGLIGLLFGVHQTGIMQFLGLWPDPPQPHLVTDGLYGLVRHPLYTCGLMVLWFNPTMTWNSLALALGVTVYILVGIRFEERKLHQVFGAQYDDYARRTPMLLPRVKRGKR